MFDVDLKSVNEALAKAKENAFVEVPAGKYMVKVEKIELGETGEKAKQPGMPMGKMQLRIVEGKYAKQCIFVNKMLVCKTQTGELSALGLHTFNELLKSLEPNFEVEFIDFEDYKDLLLDICEDIENVTYEIQYSIKNGFSDVKVLSVYAD